MRISGASTGGHQLAANGLPARLAVRGEPCVMSDYQKEWKSYRRLRTQFVLAWLGCLPIAAAILTVSEKHDMPRLGYATMAVGIVLFYLTGLRVYFWHCPRCGKKFGPTVGGMFLNVQLCVSCGLPRNSN